MYLLPFLLRLKIFYVNYNIFIINISRPVNVTRRVIQDANKNKDFRFLERKKCIRGQSIVRVHRLYYTTVEMNYL